MDYKMSFLGNAAFAVKATTNLPEAHFTFNPRQ